MSVMVIACYRPKAGKEGALLALMPRHLPALRAEGLVSDDPSLAGRAHDGTIVEIFCWKSQEAIDAAHKNPAIGAMWEKFGEVCDSVSIGAVAGASDMFMHLEPLSLTPAIAAKAPIGVEVEAGKSYFWCACGRSATQPFCDGSHKGSAFTPVKWTAPETKKAYFCACKRTNGAPLCDGSHKGIGG